jgi:hypothetical protein
MNQAIPVEVLGRIEDTLFKDATDRLTERLMEGEKVGGLSMLDLVDCELNSIPRSVIVTANVYDILMMPWPDNALKIEKFKLGMIERYLDSRVGLIHDEMNAMEERDAD